MVFLVLVLVLVLALVQLKNGQDSVALSVLFVVFVALDWVVGMALNVRRRGLVAVALDLHSIQV